MGATITLSERNYQKAEAHRKGRNRIVAMQKHGAADIGDLTTAIYIFQVEHALVIETGKTFL